MAPMIESETQLAFESLQVAELQASSLESRLDQLDASLDSLLRELESGQYGASKDAIETVLAEMNDLQRQNRSIPVQSPPPDAPQSPNVPQETRDKKSEEEQKRRDKVQEDALLDMMDA